VWTRGRLRRTVTWLSRQPRPVVASANGTALPSFAGGAVSSPLGVLAIPVTVLVGLSFSASIAAWAAHTQTEVSFIAIFRFLILPMFLFSGTFFPISTLPTPLEVIAWLTPLWHGVTLCRDLTLGDISVGHDLMHLGYLLACVTAGLLLARMTYRKRLVV
jgi:lipooligosaccharide transport system permease protein